MARSLSVVLALAMMAARGAAEVNVQPRGARVDVVATRAPVADVLDRLARQTGMKVVYDGTPPRQLVSVTVRDHTPAEAVAEVLEGLGLNYALIADPTGSRVQTLMVLTRTASAGNASSPATAPAPARHEPDSRRPYVPPGGVIPAPEEPAEDNADNGAPDNAGNQPDGSNPQAPGGQTPNAAPQQPTPGPVAPPQMFPVSPFAPQQPPATNPGAAQPGQQQQQPPP